MWCDDGRSEIDDHLAEITVPVFYFGAGGGNKTNGLATFPFLGSTELDSQILSFEPPERALFDVGHGDVLMMDQAAELVWQPILDWILAQ